MKKALVIKLCLSFVICVIIFTVVFVVNGITQTSRLFDSVENNDFDGAQKSISNGAWINRRKYLLDLSAIDLFNPTPLIIACKNGNMEIVELLLSNGANVDKTDSVSGKTPLLSALNSGTPNRFSISLCLIDHGADIHISTVTETPLSGALYISPNDSPETIEQSFSLLLYLIENDVTLDIWGGKTALTFAASYRNVDAVRYFIENELFDINSYDDNNETALIAATKSNAFNVVEELLAHGADATLVDENGKTAYDFALELNHTDIIGVLNRTP